MDGHRVPGHQPIAVCVARVMDTSSPVDFAALISGRGPFAEPRDDVLRYILNPADEAAVRLAGRLGGMGQTVLAVHVGPASGEPALRDALAAGADEALRLEPPPGQALEASAVAEALGGFLTATSPVWVLCGQATLDWGTGLVGATVAERLGWPVVDHVLEVDVEPAGGARCLRSVSKGLREEVSVPAPAVLIVSPLAYRLMMPPLRRQLFAKRATIPVQAVTPETEPWGSATWQATRPRPRPKDSLPTGFAGLPAAARLATMLEWGQPAAPRATKWLEGDAPALARRILDFIAEAGCERPAAERDRGPR